MSRSRKGYFRGHPLYTKDVLAVISQMTIQKYANDAYRFLFNEDKIARIARVLDSDIKSSQKYMMSNRENILRALLSPESTISHNIKAASEEYLQAYNDTKMDPDDRLAFLNDLSWKFKSILQSDADYDLISDFFYGENNPLWKMEFEILDILFDTPARTDDREADERRTGYNNLLEEMIYSMYIDSLPLYWVAHKVQKLNY